MIDCHVSKSNEIAYLLVYGGHVQNVILYPQLKIFFDRLTQAVTFDTIREHGR